MLSVGVAVEDNMAHAHFKLDTEGYKHTHSEYVIFITFLNSGCTNAPHVTLNAHCLVYNFLVYQHTQSLIPQHTKNQISQIIHPTWFYDQNATWIAYLPRGAKIPAHFNLHFITITITNVFS